jgi:hypothetical protein
MIGGACSMPEESTREKKIYIHIHKTSAIKPDMKATHSPDLTEEY